MKKFFISPYIKIILSFFAVILMGAILLCLPISQREREWLPFIDALFTSASAVCITGLSTIANYGTFFSTFGKIVIAFLIEIGGLSILTLTIFMFVLLGKKVGIKDRFLMKEALNQNTSSGIVRLVLTIVLSSLIIQTVGAVLSFISLVKYYPISEAFAMSIFHAISSFNNSGIDIFGYDNSVQMFAGDVFFNITTMALIILGGLGFVVLKDLMSRKRPRDMVLMTKIVLPMTVLLIVIGMIMIKLAVGSDITWLQALFQSVSVRTAGFTTYDMTELNNATSATVIMLMMIGGSPCSTAGGIKITTIFVIVATMLFYSVGKDPHVFRRRIPKRAIFKAFSLVSFMTGYLMITVVALSFCEPNQDLMKLIFTAVSALSNAGMSAGITASLKPISKVILILSMFIGRTGPTTLLNVLNNNWMRETGSDIKYVEENILIG